MLEAHDIILIVFPRQQWLRERASVLHDSALSELLSLDKETLAVIGWNAGEL
jgi:hypothetical protein